MHSAVHDLCADPVLRLGYSADIVVPSASDKGGKQVCALPRRMMILWRLNARSFRLADPRTAMDAHNRRLPRPEKTASTVLGQRRGRTTMRAGTALVIPSLGRRSTSPGWRATNHGMIHGRGGFPLTAARRPCKTISWNAPMCHLYHRIEPQDPDSEQELTMVAKMGRWASARRS